MAGDRGLRRLLDLLADAPCTEVPAVETFYAGKGGTYQEASQVCEACFARDGGTTWLACLAYVDLIEADVWAEHVHGFVAGHTAEERKAARRAGRRLAE